MPWTRERGRNHWTHRQPERIHRLLGESHPACKLSDGVVAEIRQRYKEGGITQAALAKEFGVSFQHISGIVLGKYRNAN